ncbi:MAG: diacylglycerol/lipid kinase family protein [Wenzhouxiangella sp.]
MRTISYIVNPVAGGRRGRSGRPLAERLGKTNPDAEILLTTCPGEAESLARARSMRENHVVVAVGGDGTVHEVARGLVGGRALMAVLPVGSGNDFSRMLDGPTHLDAMPDWLVDAEPRSVDVGQIRIEEINGQVSEGHFINSLGVGFEALVADSAGRARFFKGFSRYLAAALQHLARYRAPAMTLRYNGLEIVEPQFLINLGNGRSTGGGFLLTPDARIDDGLLDLCRAEVMPVARLLMILPAVLVGRHARFNGVHTDQVSRISIDCPEGCMVHGDGEIIARQAIGIEVSVYPGGLRVLG